MLSSVLKSKPYPEGRVSRAASLTSRTASGARRERRCTKRALFLVRTRAAAGHRGPHRTGPSGGTRCRHRSP